MSEPKRILMVLTSHDTLGPEGSDNEATGFWLEEFAAPYYVFKDAGCEITLASPKGGHPPIDPKSEADDFQTEATRRFNDDTQAKAELTETLRLDQVAARNFDAIFYPGGHGPLWDLAEEPLSIALIEAFWMQGKPVSAVCHAPAVLRHAMNPTGSPLVGGRKVTGFSNVEEAAVGLTDKVPYLLENELTMLGANYSEAPAFEPNVCIDEQLITGQNPASSEPTAKAVLEKLTD